MRFAIASVLASTLLISLQTPVFAAKPAVAPNITLPEMEGLVVPAPKDLPATAETEQIEKQSKIPTSERDFLNIIKKSIATLEKDPKDAGAYIDLAFANRNLDRYRKGLEYCNKAIELNADIPVAYGERALAYASLRQPEKALEDLERAIKLDPNNSAFYSNRGWIYTNQKLYAKAIEECTKSIKIYAGYSPAFYCRSRAYLATDRFEEAVSDLTAAIKLYPNQEADYYRDRAFAYIRLLEYAKALNDLVVAMRLHPNDQLAYVYKGIALSKSGAQEDAIKNLSSAIALDERNVSALKNRAVLFRITRDFDKSLSDLNAALKVAPQDDTVYGELGQTYLAMNELNKAAEQFAKAIALNPENKDYVELQARAQARKAPMATKDGFRYFVDEPIKIFPDQKPEQKPDQKPEPKVDWKGMIARVRQAKIAENLPVGDSFTQYLKRDLNNYFVEQTGKSVTTNYELLRDFPTLGPDGQPIFFCWCTIVQGDETLFAGAARVEAQNKSGFKVSNFLKVAEIAANPQAVLTVFPAPVSMDILLRAKVKLPKAPLDVTRPLTSQLFLRPNNKAITATDKAADTADRA